ncbi:dehydrogenase [Hyphomonas adhaerens MHS-3]|uniref:Dehydrogenase n=2 Tax=Hyphomonas adhaerens TaxID=81029 RepID=A0A069E7D5_9PROT|nr:dehydrogenase [Hyphomonas adhaerens MHS-3]
MKSLDEPADDFIDHLAENAGGYIDASFIKEMSGDPDGWSQLAKSLSMADPQMISALHDAAGPTIRWLEKAGIKFDFLPTAFLTTTTTRLLPVGGGLAMVETLTEKCKQAGVEFCFETTAEKLVTSPTGQVSGLLARKKGGALEQIAADAIVLASGGFEGNAEMQTQYLGQSSINLRPVARGGYYNKGEGIRMALEIGAAPNGDFGSYHAEPIDPRSGAAEPAVFIFPYGILVNKAGERFTDEAPGTVDAHYESVTREIHKQRDGIAYLILDAGIEDVPNWQTGLRTDQPAIEAGTIAELADLIKIDAQNLEATVDAYNASCQPGEFKPLETDGLATHGVGIRKSNWARPLERAPFKAYPIISANVFTFGGLKIDQHARVLSQNGEPINGLYAAGETMGIYYRVYTGSTSVLRGAVFGRLAALHATGA